MAQNSLKNSHPAGKSRKVWFRSGFEHISLLVIYTEWNVCMFVFSKQNACLFNQFLLEFPFTTRSKVLIDIKF